MATDAEFERKITAARYPRVFAGKQPYTLNGLPSGLAGAIASIAISVDTYPQAITRITFATRYQITDAQFAANPLLYQGLRQIDEDADIRIVANQQNITAQPVNMRAWQGALTILPWPLTAPYLIKGGNQIIFEAVRTTSYPNIPDGLQVLPTLEVAVHTVSLQDDRAPAGAPPTSSGILPQRRGY